MRKTSVLRVVPVLFAFVTADLAAQNQACEADERYRIMDFWVGEWDVVTASGQLAGTNTIEKVLNGCALIENWRGAGGGGGKSWFYYNNVTDTWNQIWITDNAPAVGGTKEKTLVGVFDDGGTRFQGELRTVDGKIILDRTTLTPMDDGRVRQVIEMSRDGGSTWTTSFDAFYVRKNL